MNLVLIGFMGSGKSTIARSLSSLLQFALIEMDELVYKKTKTKNMHEVFALGGEALLREIELCIAKECAEKTNQIISTGGGIVLAPTPLNLFKKNGAKIIFLHAPFDLIAKRLENDLSRPLFTDLSCAKKIYEARLPLYLQYADEIIEIGSESPSHIASTILTRSF